MSYYYQKNLSQMNCLSCCLSDNSLCYCCLILFLEMFAEILGNHLNNLSYHGENLIFQMKVRLSCSMLMRVLTLIKS